MSQRFSPPWMGAGPYRRIERMKGSSCRGIRRILSFTFRKARSKSALFPGTGRKRSSQSMRRGLWRGLSDRPATAPGDSRGDESLIMRLEKAAIVRVLHDEPKFSEVFMSYLLARNARVEEDLVDQLFNSSEKRLARLLLLMANFGKEAKPEPVIAKISQETLAEMVGTTRSRVSGFMNKFRKLGFIDYNGRLEVHSSLLNVVLHDTPEIRRGAASEE
jgi:hypothetical protein